MSTHESPRPSARASANPGRFAESNSDNSEADTPLNIQYRKCGELKPSARNPRTHSKKQIRQIACSIKEFGFTNPLLIDQNDTLMAGNGRFIAAKQLGLDKVPTIRIEHLSEDQIRAYVIADNKLAENAGWDNELLALELVHLSDLDVDLDVSITGFEMGEIDVLIGDLDTDNSDNKDDDVPAVQPGPAITQLGDIWEIGPHRLVCGNATEISIYSKLLESQHAQMVFTDPPYNVPIDGHVSGLGEVRHREFAMATGEMTGAEFTAFLSEVLGHLATNSIDGAIHFVCMDWRHIAELFAAGKIVYSELKNLCVWNKTNAGMGSLYRSQHELIFVFKHGKAQHINNVQLGRHGRYRTNVWTYPGMTAFGNDRMTHLALHPTVKPLDLVADAILDCSNRGGLILDPFAGSGTTLMAAELTGRRGYGIELDPHYCDVILRRLTRYGLSAINTANGEEFAAIDQSSKGGIHHE